MKSRIPLNSKIYYILNVCHLDTNIYLQSSFAYDVNEIWRRIFDPMWKLMIVKGSHIANISRNSRTTTSADIVGKTIAKTGQHERNIWFH